MSGLEQGPPDWMVDDAVQFYHLDKPRDVAWREMEPMEIDPRDPPFLNRFCAGDRTVVYFASGSLAHQRRTQPMFIGQCSKCRTIYWFGGVWKT